MCLKTPTVYSYGDFSMNIHAESFFIVIIEKLFQYSSLSVVPCATARGNSAAWCKRFNRLRPKQEVLSRNNGTGLNWFTIVRMVTRPRPTSPERDESGRFTLRVRLVFRVAIH